VVAALGARRSSSGQDCGARRLDLGSEHRTTLLLPNSWLSELRPPSSHRLVCAVQDGLPPFDHPRLQPGLYVHRLFDVTLDDTSSWHTSTRTVPGSLSLRAHSRACVSSNAPTDRAPKGCFEGFCHFWYLITLGFSRNTRAHTMCTCVSSHILNIGRETSIE